MVLLSAKRHARHGFCIHFGLNRIQKRYNGQPTAAVDVSKCD